MEGPLAPLLYAKVTQFQACEECPEVENCGSRIIMRRVRDSISEVLDRPTLADLIKDVEEGVGKRKPVAAIMYYM
jgi:DNA-binding IscR family transcriptional regulator